ncbi:MAG: hypothetical protein WCC22_12355 [Terriglobales bacterium]
MSYRSNTAEALYPEPALSVAQPVIPLNLAPPASLSVPLWKSLLGNLRDTFAPQKLPPLKLSSRPMDVGMLFGDRLSLPWFRTVFTNLGDVISPETLAPLELESRPVEVGELLTDQLSHLWWSSLLRNLADRLAPEKLPALGLTAEPIPDFVPAAWMLLPKWSDVISTPKVFYPDKPKLAEPTARPAIAQPPALPAQAQAALVADPTAADLRRDLRRSRIRQRVWIAFAAAQVIYLVAIAFWH